MLLLKKKHHHQLLTWTPMFTRAGEKLGISASILHLSILLWVVFSVVTLQPPLIPGKTGLIDKYLVTRVKATPRQQGLSYGDKVLLDPSWDNGQSNHTIDLQTAPMIV
jgi:hypothetical protein